MNYKRISRNIILNIVGGLIYAIAVHGFLISNHLGEGGVTGLMTIFYYWLHMPPALTNLVLNGILLLVGWKLLDKETVFYTLLAIGSISFFLPIIGNLGWEFPLHAKIVPAIAGGVLMGLAMGIIMRGHGTIAGSTILAKILNRYFGLPTGYALMIFDFSVAIPSGIIIGLENMLLTLIELYVSAIVLDKCLALGIDQKGLRVFIDDPKPLIKALTEALGGQPTIIAGQQMPEPGQFINQQVIYFVCASKDIVPAMSIIKATSPEAFVVMENIRSAPGRKLFDIL